MKVSFNFRPDSIPSDGLQKKWFFYLILLVFVMLVYISTFTGQFILDDKPLIENNTFITKAHPITSYFAQEDGISDERDEGSFHTGYYRPLINLTYWLDYKLWGISAPGFRTTNVVLHLASCFILFHILLSLIGDRTVSFLTTILFALHPVNTESVSFIAARNNIVAALFVLASFYFYMTGWERKKISALVISIVSFAIAVFSKEFGLMALPVFFLYQRVLSKRKNSFLKEIVLYLPYVIIAIIYFILRKNVTTLLLPPFDMNDLLARVYYVPYIILYNLQLIFFPRGLHSFIVPYPSSFFEWQPLLSIVVIFLLGLVMWFQRKNRILVFSALAFLVVVFPVLNVIPTKAVTLISMRWLYLPMALIMVGVASIIQKARKRRETLTIAILCVITLYFGAYSYILNKNLWHDEGSFFYQEVVNFDNYFYSGGFADKLIERKEYGESERYLKIAIDNYPYKSRNYINYSALLIDTGRSEMALSYLNKAKSLTMIGKEKEEWLNNMGVVLTDLGQYEKAIKYLYEALKMNPEYAEAYNNMGVTLAKLGKMKEAVSHFKKALTFRPDYSEAQNNLRFITGQ